jgi:hypothetical protein
MDMPRFAASMILLRPGIKPAISRTVCNPSRALSKF